MVSYPTFWNWIVPTSIPVNLKHSRYSLLLIIISGNVLLNQSPVRYPCGDFGRPVASIHRAVYCEAFITGAILSILKYHQKSIIDLVSRTFHGYAPIVDHSYFESDISINSSLSSRDDCVFEEIRQVLKTHLNEFVIALLNINSLTSKFLDIQELLKDKILDLLFLPETKIDSSFLNYTFEVAGYKFQTWQNIHGGGLAVYIRSDVPSRRRTGLEHEHLEAILWEVTLSKSKWCLYMLTDLHQLHQVIFTSIWKIYKPNVLLCMINIWL